MESAVTQAQVEELAFNITHNMDNRTSFSDNIDWMRELRMNPVYKAAMFIQQYYSFILSAIGVPFNMLSFLVLRRIKPLTSAILIMMLLAVADSLNLMLSTLDAWVASMHITYTNIGCPILLTAIYLLQYMPMWLVVLLTLERVVAVCFPMKASQVCTISNACRSILILFILDVTICVVHTFIYEERRIGLSFGCFLKAKYVTLYEQWMMADSAFFVFIPLIVLCLSNMAIVIKLRTLREIQSEAIVSSLSEENKRQNRSVTVMLLAISVTTIICIGPNLVLSVFGSKWSVSDNVSPSTYARRRLAMWVIMFFTKLNNAVNFFLYILSGRRFRTNLCDIVASCFGKLRLTL